MYFGWWIVAMAAMVLMVVNGITFAAFGLFVLPVSEDLQLSRSDMNGGLVLLNVGVAAIAPFAGPLIDKYPARLIMLVSSLILGCSFLVLSASSLVWLSALMLAVPLVLGMQSAGVMSILVPRWFVAQRGRAMTLATLGSAAGSIVCVPLVGLLIDQFGWRTALAVIGWSAAAILLLVTALIRERPGPNDIEPVPAGVVAGAVDGASLTGPRLSIPQILRMPQFWTISLSSAVVMGCGQTMLATLVPLAREAGITMLAAASLISISGVAAIAGKLALSIVADRIERIYLLAGLFSLGALIYAALLLTHSYAVLGVAAAIFGVSAGVAYPTFGALLADRFGVQSLGTVMGLAVPMLTLMAAGGLILAGKIYDRTGEYSVLFTLFVAVQSLAVAGMLATRLTRAVRPPCKEGAAAI